MDTISLQSKGSFGEISECNHGGPINVKKTGSLRFEPMDK